MTLIMARFPSVASLFPARLSVGVPTCRTTAIGLLTSALLSTACSGVPSDSAGFKLNVGDVLVVPGAREANDTPVLVWVFDAKACLGCELTVPASHVRGFQRRVGDVVGTHVVAVSDEPDTDRVTVESFLRLNRVSGDLTILDRASHRRAFGSGPLNAFYVVGPDDRVHAVVVPDRPDESSSLDLISIAERLVQAAGKRSQEE